MTLASRSGPEMWRMGVDVGGTFTDLVLHMDDGAINVYKVLSAPEDPAEGVLAAFRAAAGALGLSLEDFLGRCEVCVHGSTVATNTLLERKGARVGLLTTEGFRDSLEIRRGTRRNPWQHRMAYSPVLVPRFRRAPIRGRIEKNGAASEPLNAEDVKAAIALFHDEDVQSIAVCLFNGFINPDHERECRRLLGELWKGDWISISSEISPNMGEYERTSTTVMNAYLAPRTVTYLRNLDRRLVELGMPRPLLLIQNNGGAISVSEAGERPVSLLLSGPAAGVGALDYYGQLIGSGNLISMEIGGTSCDSILVSEGKIGFTDRLEIEDYHLALPAVDVHSIGAGGGTIAGVDPGGMLFVGPQGAGARPGPACYGFGGEEPTVTDAHLVLGRFETETYADGAIPISVDLARDAIRTSVAEPLRIELDQAAAGIIRLMEQKLLHALQRISTERGHNPGRFTLVACGGGGGLHGAAVGRMLGCPRVYIPRLAGVFCALGMLNSDTRHDYGRVYLSRLESADSKEVTRIFAELESRARRVLEREGFCPSECTFGHAGDLRYLGQQWTITVPVDRRLGEVEAVRRAFEAEHRRLFGHIQPEGIIEITMLRLVATGALPRLVPATSALASMPAVARGRRRVWVNEAIGWTEAPIYDGADLQPGHRLAGPAIINERTTTVLVGDHDELSVDAAGNYLVELGSAE